MAFIKILFCIALVLFAQAVATRSSDEDWVSQHMTMASHNFQSLPFKPNFPSYTQLPVFNPFKNLFEREIELPSAVELVNRESDPDKDFSNIVLRKTSNNLRDKEGKKINSGGTTVVSNYNGNVDTRKAGVSPPDINDEFVFPSMPKFGSLFKDFDMEPMKPFVFPPIKPIDLGEIEKYTPKDGEDFIGSGHSTSFSTSTVNGVTKSSGSEEKVVNKGGHVTLEKKGFGEKDKNRH